MAQFIFSGIVYLLLSITIPPAYGTHSYFVTITLPPKWYKKRAIKQLHDSRSIIKSYCDNFFSYANFVAELTEKCNIHWHGMVNFREDDQYAMLKFHDMSRFSRIDCQPVKGLTKVWNYIHEDIPKTIRILEMTSSQMLFINKKPLN